MMMDTKGCVIIVAILCAIGLVIGLVAHWLGASGWAPIIGAAVVPVILGGVLLFMFLSLLASGMSR